MNCTYRYDW